MARGSTWDATSKDIIQWNEDVMSLLLKSNRGLVIAVEKVMNFFDWIQSDKSVLYVLDAYIGSITDYHSLM